MKPLSRINKIGIIGGGIGGLFLTSSIVQCWDDYPDIYIFDPRFDERGPARPSQTSGLVYQGWAGAYGIPYVDPSVIAHKIDTITFHKGDQKVEIPDPLGRKICIINRNPVRRNGELIPSIYQHIQRFISRYDRIHFLPFSVDDLSFSQGSNNNFTILCTDYNGKTHEETVDGVVFTTLPPKVKETLSKTIGYRPPKTWPGASFDVSLKRGKWLPKYQTLHKFFVGGGQIHTIDLIPRGDVLTVVALGKGASLSSLYRRIEKDPDIQRYLPDHWPTRVIEGSASALSVPVGQAENVIADGLVCLGGQVFGELLINGGLYSNLWAAELLAKALKKSGFRKEGLEQFYFAKVMKVLRFQNLIGKALYVLTDRFVLPSARVSSLFLQKIDAEKELPSEKRLLTRFAWDILIGEEPFSRALVRILQGIGGKMC
ncbi:MAG: hypothetical protein JRE23_05315 [Deltaproteobacteria bacterium]|nr:hypothetical protein [Deltaproteobacteria bacterium]